MGPPDESDAHIPRNTRTQKATKRPSLEPPPLNPLLKGHAKPPPHLFRVKEKISPPPPGAPATCCSTPALDQPLNPWRSRERLDLAELRDVHGAGHGEPRRRPDGEVFGDRCQPETAAEKRGGTKKRAGGLQLGVSTDLERGPTDPELNHPPS